MAAANSVTVTTLSLIKAAMQEIGALSAGETPSDDDQEWVLEKLQRLIDRYNARLPMVYNVNFVLFNLLANHAPHTIGPGADFDVIQRPVNIVSASVVLVQSTANVDVPLNIRDDAWWANERVKNLKSTYPTDLYYDASWPVGNCNFWPIPSQANGMRLGLRGVLAQITSYDQAISLPPAYWDAIVYPLAYSLCPSFKTTASPELQRLGAMALKAIETNNISSPRGVTVDAGMPGGRKYADWNYYSGMPTDY